MGGGLVGDGVEEGGLDVEEEAEPSVSGRDEDHSRALLSSVLTLTLSILGRRALFLCSSVMSIPYAWSRLGILCGLITQIIVASCNAMASVLLLKTAAKVRCSSYESTAEAVGGPFWKLITQISLFILLFGTIVGDFALLGSTAQLAVHNLSGGSLPKWLDENGRMILIILVLFCVLPLCCLRRMRSLETASTAGLLVIVAFFVIIVYQTSVTGFPAIRSGELPLWKLKVTEDLPEAMAVMGFAFYIAPMLLPLRTEMPPGKAGDKLTMTASVLVILVIAQIVYGMLGAFGASRHGMQTNGNVMVNTWLPPKPQGVLDLVMAVYLAISIPPISLSLRYTLTCLLVGEHAPYEPTRHYLLTGMPTFAALAIALFFPQASEKVFAVTGATGVMLICYLLPVILHLLLRSKSSRSDETSEGLLSTWQERHMSEERDSLSRRGALRDTIIEVVLPCLLAIIGVSISLSALVIAILNARR